MEISYTFSKDFRHTTAIIDHPADCIIDELYNAIAKHQFADSMPPACELFDEGTDEELAAPYYRSLYYFITVFASKSIHDMPRELSGEAFCAPEDEVCVIHGMSIARERVLEKYEEWRSKIFKETYNTFYHIQKEAYGKWAESETRYMVHRANNKGFRRYTGKSKDMIGAYGMKSNKRVNEEIMRTIQFEKDYLNRHQFSTKNLNREYKEIINSHMEESDNEE